MSLDNAIPIPLFHGTDKTIFNYSEKERMEIQEMCTRISDYTYSLFLEDGLSVYSPSVYKAKRLSEIGNYWYPLLNAFQKYDSRIKGSTLYQYDSLYLTGDRRKAEDFARNAFILGEQGKVAYELYTAASQIWDFKKCSHELVDLFERFERMALKPRIPIIITFNHILKDDLLGEKGEELDWEMWGDCITRLNYRVKPGRAICLTDGRVEYL